MTELWKLIGKESNLNSTYCEVQISNLIEFLKGIGIQSLEYQILEGITFWGRTTTWTSLDHLLPEGMVPIANVKFQTILL